MHLPALRLYPYPYLCLEHHLHFYLAPSPHPPAPRGEMEMAMEVESSYLYFRLYLTHLKIYFHLNLDVDLHPDIQEGFGFRVQGLEFKVRDRSVYRGGEQSRGRGDEMGMEVDVRSSYLYRHLHLRTSLP